MIQVVNPSPEPLEIEFFLASSDVESEFDEWLLHESKIPLWSEAGKIAFDYDIHNKIICEQFENLFEYDHSKKQTLFSFFVRNFINIIKENKRHSENLTEFLSE